MDPLDLGALNLAIAAIALIVGTTGFGIAFYERWLRRRLARLARIENAAHRCRG